MSILSKNSITGATAILLFIITGLIPYEHHHHHLRFTAEGGECIDYEASENTITIECNASFLDVVQNINDPDILENVGDSEYILNANLEVADDVSFAMTSNQDGLQYLKIIGANGIIVYGKILIYGVKITSWDISDEDVIQQNINGTIGRGYVQFAASEGAEIINSEFGYLGYVEPGRRGFDLLGGGVPSHDMVIRGSKFHDMWMAFYSRGAYNITVDGNEYYNNIKYALDPHTGTYNMNITNNWLHHNLIGATCSDDCYNVLIEGNLAEHNSNAGIFLSRNMTDSIARNNNVYNSSTGILVSESSNNQIYNNTIEGATEEGILLVTPDIPDDGVTEGNVVYDNFISDSESGIRSTLSQDNILENNTFDDIESSEYLLSGNSSMIIRGQDFEDTSISEDGSATENIVEIVDSGIIEVREEDGDDDDDDDEENSYDTDDEPYRTILSDGDSIIVNS